MRDAASNPGSGLEVRGDAANDLAAPIGTYWTTGALVTTSSALLESYATCARCGAFVNAEDRHDDWHRSIEAGERDD